MYPVHGPCVAALAAPGFHQADSQRAAPFACRLCQTLGGWRFRPAVSHCQVRWLAHPERPLLRVARFTALKPQARGSVHSCRLAKLLRSSARRLPLPLAPTVGGRCMLSAPATGHLLRSVRADRGRSASGFPNAGSLKSIKPHAPSSARAARPSAVSARPASLQPNPLQAQCSIRSRMGAQAVTLVVCIK